MSSFQESSHHSLKGKASGRVNFFSIGDLRNLGPHYLNAHHSPDVGFRLSSDYGGDERSREHLWMSLLDAGLGNLQVVQRVDKSVPQVPGSLSGHGAVRDVPELGVGLRRQLGMHVHIPVAAHEDGNPAILGTKYGDEGKQLLTCSDAIPESFL